MFLEVTAENLKEYCSIVLLFKSTLGKTKLHDAQYYLKEILGEDGLDAYKNVFDKKYNVVNRKIFLEKSLVKNVLRPIFLKFAHEQIIIVNEKERQAL